MQVTGLVPLSSSVSNLQISLTDYYALKLEKDQTSGKRIRFVRSWCDENSKEKLFRRSKFPYTVVAISTISVPSFSNCELTSLQLSPLRLKAVNGCIQSSHPFMFLKERRTRDSICSRSLQYTLEQYRSLPAQRQRNAHARIAYRLQLQILCVCQDRK